jgi:hypothetical protein
VSLRITDEIAAEPGVNIAVFTVARTGALETPLTVFYTASGSASNGLDFEALSGSVVIPAGASNAPVVVQPIDDVLPEAVETVMLTLKSNATYVLGSPYGSSTALRDDDNLAPSVSLIAPDDLAVLNGPTNILLQARVSDADGWVRNVSFYKNGLWVGSAYGNTASGAPVTGGLAMCSVMMSNVVSGHLTLTAVAYDNLGLAATSTPVSVTVTQDPAVTVVKVVASDAYASEPGTDTGAFVVYRMGSTNQDLTVLYTVNGSAVSDSDYASLPGSVTIPAGAVNATIPVRALDDALAEPSETVVLTLADHPAYFVGDPRSATVYVRDNETNRPAAVALTSPASGASFTDPATIPLTAEAMDADGAVSRVEFHVNGVLWASDSTAPYAASWNSPAMGTHTLTAKAFDNLGAVSTSQPVVVTVRRTPLVTLSVPDGTASEPGVDTATIQVTRSGNLNGDLLVPYAVAGTALPGQDYEALSGSAVIPAGRVSVPIVIRPIDDALQELTETVTVTLSSNATYLLSSYRSATVSIRDNETNRPPTVALTSPSNGASFTDPSSVLMAAEAADADGAVARVEFYRNGLLVYTDTSAPYAFSWVSPETGAYTLTARAFDNLGAATTSQPVAVTVTRTPMISLSVSDGTASEPGNDTATISVNRSGNTNGDLVVAYTVSGTAIPGVDYDALPGSVTIPAGVTKVALVVRPIDDAVQERAETVIVTLSSNATSLLGSYRSATVSILDNETNLPPVVALSAPTNGAAFVDPTHIQLSADASDPDGALAKVEFYANTMLVGVDTNAPFALLWAAMMEGSYVLTARATDGMGAVTTSQPVTVTVSRAPAVRIVTLDAYAGEGGSDLATVKVYRSYNTNLDLEVNYTLGGTASNGVDFAPLTGSIMIPAGKFYTNIVIQPLDDALVESTETVVLTLAAGGAMVLSDPRSAVVYIKDNETNTPPAVVLTAPADGATLTDPTNVVLAADAVDSDGRVARVDYLANGRVIGSATNAPFTSRWAGMLPGVYQLYARAFDNLGASSVSRTATVTIVRTPLIQLVASDTRASEAGGDAGCFMVYRYENTNESVVVHYAVSGTASNGVDYVVLPGTVTIPAGAMSVAIPLQPLDDGIDVEPPMETIGLCVLPDPAYRIGAAKQGTVYLYNKITPNLPPAVALVAPTNGSTFTLPVTVTLRAEASDPDGTIAKVEFLVGGTVINTRSNAPYAYSWSANSAGAYTLSARATDNRGTATLSPSIRVTVSALPTPSAYRYLPLGYVPGVKLLAMISVSQPAGLGAYTVTEQPPANWSVSGVRSGSYDPVSGLIEFGPFTNSSQVLYYDVTPPQTTSGAQGFTGVVSSATVTIPVRGTMSLSPVPPHPADKAPSDFVMTLDEAAAYADGWMHASSISNGPAAGASFGLSPAVNYVARGGYLWKRGGGYTLSTNYPTPVPPMLWVADAAAQAAPSDRYGTATSSMPTNYTPGVPFTVTIAVTPASTAVVFAIDEHVPTGWKVSDVSDGGVYLSSVSSVRWGLFLDGQPASVSYVVTPATNTATYGSFYGVTSFDGINLSIGGVRKTVRSVP